MTRPKNLVVAQSGGPTPVINSSLQGIIEAAREFAAVGVVYGARHGIEGVLKEELLDLTSQPSEEVALLRHSLVRGTPFGDPKWQQRLVTKLGLESTMRPRGRPRKTPL